MAADLEIRRESVASSVNYWTMKSHRHQKFAAAVVPKQKEDDQKLLKKIYFSVQSQQESAPKKKCVCAPTSHPGSFRCRLHRNETSGNVSNGRRVHHPAPNRRKILAATGSRTYETKLSHFAKAASEGNASAESAAVDGDE